MKHAITYSFLTAKYSVHSLTCQSGKANDTRSGWVFDGTVAEAVADCVRQEQEKGDNNAPAIIARKWARVCKCAK